MFFEQDYQLIEILRDTSSFAQKGNRMNTGQDRDQLENSTKGIVDLALASNQKH